MDMRMEALSRGLLGMFFLIGLCYILSNNRKAINWKLVSMGIIAQIGFAIGVLTQGKYNFFRMLIQWLSDKFVQVIGFGHKGIEFMFGNLADASGSWGYTFAIQALPNIIFFAALSSLLYYLGILQKVVYFFALLLSKLKVSGAESVSTAANIFLGQTEAPLMVRPFLEKMNRSEILCIMVGGMANTAGSVLAAYVGFLGGNDVDQQHYFALHLLSQSIMSAPAAIVCSKILFPQTDAIDKNIVIGKEKFGENALDAISLGTTDGLKLAVNVGAILIVFTALMYVLNWVLGSIGYYTGLNSIIASFSNGRYDSLSFQMILGYLFSPIAWMIGVDKIDMISVGQLLGEKTIINEFQAYITFGKMKASGLITDPKSILITTYALCGFANIASIGIQIGGISQLAPTQRKNLTELGFKALIGGTIACLMCACIAGAIS
jgi:CNT family concentrative nucleoside transporter